jgi:fucose 4-O-acetylase-like acetyltransferase
LGALGCKLTEINKQRIDWTDIAKGLGILAVILGHCHLPEEVWNSIYSWHMPIFFVISGYFYRIQPFEILIKKKFNSLLKPYFYTCGTIALIEGVKAGLVHWSTYFGHKISKIRCQKNK